MRGAERALAVTALVLAAACGAPAEGEPRRDQERKGARLIDHGYGFAYSALPGWEVLDERGAHEVLPAQVLAVGPHSHFVAVHSSVAPTPQAWVLESLDGFGLEGGRLAQLEVDGRTMVWTTRPCVFGGVPVRLVLGALAHRGRVLGLTCWRPASDAPRAEELQALWRQVQLLPGDELPRRPAPRSPDEVGVGWRTHDGTFESAAFGLTFSPSPDLVLLVGPELAELHDEAVVGWSQPQLGLSGALIAERAPPERAKAYALQLAKAFVADVGREPAHTVDAKLDRASLRLRVYRFPDSSGGESCLAYGVLAHEGLVLQVQIEWPAAQLEAGLEAIPQHLACARLLPADVRADLAAKLLAKGDPQHELGPDYVLRGGVFQDFTHRLRWEKPVGFWRAQCTADPEYRLQFTAPQLGLGGSCAVEELPEALDPATVHRAVRDAVLADAGAEPDGEPTAVKGREVEFLVTRFTLQGELELRCALATAVVGGHALSVRIWGQPQLMADHERAVAACLRGFHPLNPSVRAVSLGPLVVEHPRLGYRVRVPGEGWSETIEPSPDWHRHHAVFTKGEVRVEVLGVSQPGFAASASAQAAARVSTQADLAERLRVEFARPRALEHGELRGLRLQAGAAEAPDGVQAALLQAGDRLLTVVVSGPPGERPELGEVLDGVRFLE